MILHLKNITVDYQPEERQPACFICSWKRRKVLFSLARERGCNKLALGHHLEDAVETLLMNMIHQSSISSIPPILKMFDGELHIIRPLIFAFDKELKKYSELLGFPNEISLCPYGDETSRNAIAELLIQTKRLNSNAIENIFRSMGNILDEYIVAASIKKENHPQVKGK